MAQAKAVDWSMEQILDPQFRMSMMLDPDNVQGLARLHFTDGTITCSARVALLNLIFLSIPAAFGIPLRKDHFIKRMPYTTKTCCKAFNRYYDEIMGMSEHNAKRLKQVIWNVWEEIHEWCSIELIPWTSTLDMMDLAEIMDEKPMAEILETKKNIRAEDGSNVIEKYVDEQNKRIMDLLGTKGALKNEALYTYQYLGQLNKFQVPQTLYAFGVRTDISDSIVGLPVVGSAVDGLQDAMEFAVEHLSAKKSAVYNKVAVPESQYFGRKQELLVSTVRHIYSNDCGSPALIKFRVTENNYENLVGKLCFKDGKSFYADKGNVGSLVGEEIMMRSPMTCRYRNGVCEVCGGKIFNNINRKLNIGILCAIHVIEPTTQKILSAKHLVKTKSLVYALPGKAADILFLSSANEIRWKPVYYDKIKGMTLGVPQKYFGNVHDVVMLRADRPVKEEQFSEIKQFVLRDKKGKMSTFDLMNGAQVPFFSAEMLFHIRDHYNDLQVDENIIWIPLEGTEKFPIFRTVVVNDNMLQFVSQVSGFLSSRINSYTSCSDALQAFSDIIHAKVNANITHLETLLKAYLITSPGDYRIPLVTDPENVMFQTLNAILDNRHVGTKLAYEGLYRYMRQPSTYLVRHQSSIFDPLSIGM